MTEMFVRGRTALVLARLLLTAALCVWLVTPAAAQPVYTTLNFGTDGTFLTGIRGDNIVGNYVIQGSGETGGLLYDLATQTWTPFPVETSSGVNFPGAIGSSPYGPSFGSQFGILRAVGSYKTQDSTPNDLSYLYDGAAAPGNQITPLFFPSGGSPTLNTIAHSTFGNQVVGNYDTQLATGNAFIYDIPSGTYTTNNAPGAVSTTAYGIWGDKIAGGWGGGPGPGLAFEHGYIYDRVTGIFTVHDHPGAVFTHFEGITGAGRADEYNLVADWAGVDAVLHASVLHIGPGGVETWIELDIPGATGISANSAFADKVIGVYVLPGGTTNGYVATIPQIYNPISNFGALVATAPALPALAGGQGDDVVNAGTIRTSGAASSGIRSDTYGVVTNTGLVSVTGAGSAAVEMNGVFGSLLNAGTLQAAPGADAIRTGLTATGTLVVNQGVIDGRVLVAAGPYARFENSGWLGVSAPGAGTIHAISGTFAQTATGTLALRIGATDNDALDVAGAARLAGTLAAGFQSEALSSSYTVLRASDGRTGTFDSLTTSGLPSFMAASLVYAPTDVTLNLTAQMAQFPGLTANQQAVGGALDRVFNASGALPDGLDAVFGLSADQLPGALAAFSGEAHASAQSMAVNGAFYSRQAVLGRLRQIAYAEEAGPQSALAYAGTTLAYRPPDPAGAAAGPASPDDALTTQAMVADAAPPHGPTFWAQAIGGWGRIDGDGNASQASSDLGGLISGADMRISETASAGIALGYSRSTSRIDALASSTEADTGLIGLYGSTTLDRWKLRGAAVYELSQIDSDRAIALPGFADLARADYDAGAGQIFGEIGYGLSHQGVAIEPFAGLTWVHLNTDGFTEAGGAAALTGADAASDVGYAVLGISLATEFHLFGGMVLAPHASLAWQHAFGDLTPTTALAFAGIAGSNFTVAGVPLAADEALLDVGADLQVSDAVKLGISYSGKFADSAHCDAVKGGFTWRF